MNLAFCPMWVMKGALPLAQLNKAVGLKENLIDFSAASPGPLKYAPIGWSLPVALSFRIFPIFLRFWQTLTIGLADDILEPSGLNAAMAQGGIEFRSRAFRSSRFRDRSLHQPCDKHRAISTIPNILPDHRHHVVCDL